ncbi:MAG: hypothetical protein AB7G37_06340 [Solirubrobacteraceae bacterium]
MDTILRLVGLALFVGGYLAAVTWWWDRRLDDRARRLREGQ